MNWITLAGAIVAALGFGGYYYLMVMAKGSPQRMLGKDFTMPDVHLHYSPDMLFDTIESAGESGRPEMRRYWLYDFGLMLCLLGVMFAVTANIAATGSWIFYLMIILSLVRTAVDAGEDLIFLRLLRSYPEQYYGMAKFAGFMTTLKHILFFVWLVLLFFLLLLSAFNLSN
ncbi:MAG TPA: hypothetical protein PK537_04840 [Candidatus Limiplasma sp.]|nr:hypothetical protein [Candidatus Limiplasma sp.]